jgi:hypothetical protein
VAPRTGLCLTREYSDPITHMLNEVELEPAVLQSIEEWLRDELPDE